MSWKGAGIAAGTGFAFGSGAALLPSATAVVGAGVTGYAAGNLAQRAPDYVNMSAKEKRAFQADAVLTAAGVVGTVAQASRAGAAVKSSGDLTHTEVRQIQKVVNEAGRPLEVVGSAASGTRRGVGTNLPIGKGPGTRSDIDYLVPPSSSRYYDGLQEKLPSIDSKTGIIPGVGNPNIGPVIRFEPQ